MNRSMMALAPVAMDVSRAEAGRDEKDNPNRGGSRKENDMTATRNRKRTTPNPIVKIAILAVALAAGVVHAAEPPKAGPAAAIVLPPPKVELPPLPADGSGIWRLHLEDAGPGATPLWIVMAVDKGKIARAVAVPIHYPEHLGMGVWGDVDASTLSWAKDRISGRLSFALLPPWDWPNVKLRAKNQHRPYEPKPAAPIQVELEARIAGESGSGNWSIARAAKDGDPGKGTVVVRREPPLPLPEIYDLEFFLPGGLGDAPGASDEPELWLRARMGKAGSIKVVGNLTRLRRGLRNQNRAR